MDNKVMHLYAIYDKELEEYGDFSLAPNDIAATRRFRSVLASALENNIAFDCSCCELVKVGTFNFSTGELLPIDKILVATYTNIELKNLLNKLLKENKD